MLVSNWLLDGVMFGALLLAIVIDAFVPATHGVITLLVVAAITYFTAEDSSHGLHQRGLWSQDSLSTSLAVSMAGFIYYWWRNDSDAVATALHIGLMMSSLMLLIGVVAALGACITHRSVLPLIGLLATFVISLMLGVLAGLLVYLLTSNISLPLKLAVVLIGAVFWKVRESVHRPIVNDPLPLVPPTPSTPAGETVPPAMRSLVPQHGSVLDRFLPSLLLGPCAFIVLQQAFGFVIK
jgi:hypothetical protein